MRLIKHWFIFVLILAGLLLSGCGGQIPVTGEEEQPVQLQPIEGTDLNVITLTQKAAERLGLETVPVVSQQVDGADWLVVPYAAVLYDPEGKTWVYLNTKPFVFERTLIVVDHIEGDKAFLSKGPASGSVIVTTGAAELFGSETEFEEE